MDLKSPTIENLRDSNSFDNAFFSIANRLSQLNSEKLINFLVFTGIYIDKDTVYSVKIMINPLLIFRVFLMFLKDVQKFHKIAH